MDVQKAYFTHTGQSKKKIKRSFYEVDETDGVEASKLRQEKLSDFIRKTNTVNGY